MGKAAKAKPRGGDEYTSIQRFTEFLACDYQRLHEYLGETQFVEMAQIYFFAHPSEYTNLRWYSQHLADFLRTYPTFQHHPEIQELAALELALSSAFNAPEVAILTLTDATELDSAFFHSSKFEIHPSATRLTFKHNTTSIWSALKCEVKPPKPHILDKAQHILVWRQGVAPRFRLLGDEEAAAYDTHKSGADFLTLCAMIALIESPETTAHRVACYLREWVEADILLLIPAFAVRLEK